MKAAVAPDSGLVLPIHQNPGRLGMGVRAEILSRSDDHANLIEGAPAGFSVVVSCTSTNHFEGGTEQLNLGIRSEATLGALGDSEHVCRQIQASGVL
ncbi:MAG: hypothetical protein CL933_04175 [Deltaproteobacteria bacterium]|nr:hypothetical protein [Deltaproteobacteria bacterium]